MKLLAIVLLLMLASKITNGYHYSAGYSTGYTGIEHGNYHPKINELENRIQIMSKSN